MATEGQPTQFPLMTWDRRCDLKNIFAQKFGENIGVFCSNYVQPVFAKI
jgi:hypothetical protein